MRAPFSSSESAAESEESIDDGERGERPRPVDLRVPSGARVAAVTGPNTGGKTAALKTLGVSVLMAQAGMWLRLEADPDSDSPEIEDPKVRVPHCVCLAKCAAPE